MTISTTASVVTYLGNGTTTNFTFPFVGVSATDLEVILTNSSGTASVLSPSTYTLIINAPAVGSLWGIGGTVIYPTIGSPLASGNELTIQRIVPYTQTVSIANQGAFYPQAVEQGLDLLELQIQQLGTQVEYSLQVPTTDPNPPTILPPAAQRANGYLGFDNFGQPIITTTAPPVGPTVLSASPRKINATGTNTYAILSTDSSGGVSIYQSSTPVTTLQLPSAYGPFPVFDGSLNSSTYQITVLPPASLSIQGQTSFKIAYNGASYVFFNDGTQILID